MPVHYEIDKDLQVVFERGTGRATQGDFAELIQGLADDEDFHPGMNGISDFRELTFDLPTDEIEELCVLMLHNEEAFGDSRFAVVAQRDLEFGLVRMFCLMLEGARFKVRAFREIDEARQWIGLPVPSANPARF